MIQWTVKSLFEWTVSYLKELPVDNPRHEAEYFISELLNTNRTGVYLNYQRPVSSDELALFKSWLLRRKKHEPIQYIIGKAYFMGLTFEIGSGCFIPRFATETLVELVLNRIRSAGKDITMLEIGGGSGAIAVSCAKYAPTVRITCVEKQPIPTSFIKKNSENNGVQDRITVIQDDYRSLGDFSGYDIIVSNPPYIAEADRETLDEQVREFEPHEALFAGDDGMEFYRKFAATALETVSSDVYIYFEIGYNQADAVCELYSRYGCSAEIHKDLEGHDRVVMIRRIR